MFLGASSRTTAALRFPVLSAAPSASPLAAHFGVLSHWAIRRSFRLQCLPSSPTSFKFRSSLASKTSAPPGSRYQLRLNMVIRPVTTQAPAAMPSQPTLDPNTLSNYHAWRTTHTTADFLIDFEAKRLSGSVALSLDNLTKSDDHIILDTSYLEIFDVKANGEKVEWLLEPTRKGAYGSPLTIKLNKPTESSVKLHIELRTTQDCTALQWLTPAQTSNKKFPYMFSQCQAIHARSLFPCQDTPGVKSTYTFNIRSPLPVLASGLPTGPKDFEAGKDGKSGTLLYTFHQKIPMPSYLFALASGDLASASIGPRSTVWTGPEELKDSQWEFEADTEAYIQAAEKIVYPYAWTTYNVLVLPPSFPYGGMENPVYTFATPTLISGDRQNVDVIAHELSHSWSGNLVSNASWEHFWLNEGWTTYLERRLQMAIHKDEKHRDFSAIIGWKALSDSIEQFGVEHNFTRLIPDLKGQDPDDAFSSVPYEKGFTFLYYLEKLVGLDKWDKFIPHYFTAFKERSVDSFEFKATLLSFFASDEVASKKLNEVDWETWFYKPGYPPKPDFDTTMVDACYALADKWVAYNQSGSSSTWTPSSSDISSFIGNQIVVFLEKLQTLPEPLRATVVEDMGERYNFASSQNVEIVSRYLVLGLKAHAEKLYPRAAELAGQVGRMKFVRPLYRGLIDCDATLAKDTFEKNKDFYHPICRGMIEKILGRSGL